ncbi:SDR family oxidoreductase [Brevibacillus composti]|uniref:SDR family oxidoreductase n=1 Tax=Brevibacillus composti TaxID=2796470 RepID=A0A7T5EPI3_9BACL|nr:SDR family oxidoreductase [Brevibacillus composti]QQE76375.1 SDR family oxidoreductase [Brevibacillus composti]QUO43402.1 SDR family oxidoreductase [Brevibacillus composti]
MDLHLQGKVAIVLASTKGLGRATAFCLAKEGADVVLSGRDEAALNEAKAEILQATGREPLALVTDVTKAEDIERLVAETVNRYGRVDILINNAGGPPAGTFDQLSDEQWTNAFELNLLSFVRSIRAVLPHMRRQQFGRIVNFASSSFKQPLENLILSNTFRTGIVGLAKSLATELGPDGILINTIGPGRIATDRVAALDQIRAQNLQIDASEVRKNVEAAIPLGRYGEPEEFARMATFLASPANSYVTGQAFLVDGGLVKAI